MIYEFDIHSLFLRGFGLKDLPLQGEISNPFGQNPITILSYWYCYLDGGGMPFFGYERIMYGVIQTNQWRKAYLIEGSMVDTEVINAYQNVENPLPQKTIDLTNWDDPVAKALSSVYVFPIADQHINKAPFYYYYDFMFGSAGCEGSFEGVGPSHKPLDQFYPPLLKALGYFAQFYEDPPIKTIAKILNKTK